MMRIMTVRWPLLAAILCLAGCSSSSAPKTEAATPKLQSPVPASANPVAKYIELAGFRIREKKPGVLQIQFGVVNHSEADIGDITLAVDLRASSAKDTDPPILSFVTPVPALGPEDLKPITIEAPTKLRAYELPDWQFLKPQFRVVEPK